MGGSLWGNPARCMKMSLLLAESRQITVNKPVTLMACAIKSSVLAKISAHSVAGWLPDGHWEQTLSSARDEYHKKDTTQSQEVI